MLTDDEIVAIEALLENASRIGVGFTARTVIPALLADRRELLTLARELAEALTQECAGDVGASFRNHTVLAKARAAGLLEADRG